MSKISLDVSVTVGIAKSKKKKLKKVGLVHTMQHLNKKWIEPTSTFMEDKLPVFLFGIFTLIFVRHLGLMVLFF